MITQALTKLLYIDIETAGIVEDFMELPDRLGDIWMQKHEDDGSPSKSYREQAGLHAEFAKVVCVSVGYFFTEPDQKEQKFKVLSLTGTELAILTQLEGIMNKLKGYNLCGWNIKGFDVPFLCKRYVINGKSLPAMINNVGKKPWDVNDLDLMEIWKFSSFQGKSASLDLVTAVLGIPSPKGDMNGSMVGKAFYEGHIEEIGQYCANDVIGTARVSQVFNGLIYVSDENVVRA